MGMVYKARQPQLDRFVALKILSPELSRDPAFAERFTREARALARLSHPNIVAVFDFGQAADFYYFIMEYVDGMSLWQMEQARKPLAPEEALAIIPKICDALQYAHDEGIVHRDIKPGNILVDKKGRVKIADFGIAKLMGQQPQDFKLTQSKMMLGTLQYMAPEQFEDPQKVDHRVDIYSLGVVFYEMLTGELPMGRYALPSEKVHVDVRLDEVVLRALARQPERRYQQASEVRTAVESFSRSEPVPVPPSVQAPDRFWRRFAVAITLGVLALLLVGGGGILVAILVPAINRARTHAVLPAPVSVVESSGQVLGSIDWQKLPEQIRLLGGTPVTIDGRSALKIVNTNDAPLQLSLFVIDAPGITTTIYALTGQIKYEDVQGDGFLEMWSCFRPPSAGSPELKSFTRTLDIFGPTGKITGTSAWRDFSLPFNRTGVSSSPSRLEVNIILPGKGMVFLGPIKLTQF
jgi:serine/threonine protein kinase